MGGCLQDILLTSDYYLKLFFVGHWLPFLPLPHLRADSDGSVLVGAVAGDLFSHLRHLDHLLQEHEPLLGQLMAEEDITPGKVFSRLRIPSIQHSSLEDVPV